MTVKFKISKMLEVLPKDTLFDSPNLKIAASQLKPNQNYTLVTRIDFVTGKFISFSHYKSNKNGIFDCASDESYGGDFTGIENLGPIWSIKALAGERRGIRLLPRETTKPMIYNFCLYENWLSNHEEILKSHPISKTSINRHFIHQDVERIQLRHGRLRGILFIPKTTGKLPAILDLFGTNPGLIEHRAALMSAKGYITLALAYFAYDDLPNDLSETKLEYFEEALDYLRNHHKVNSNQIGVIGSSLGAEIAISIMSLLPGVKVAMAINGQITNNNFNPLTYHGKKVSFAKYADNKDFDYNAYINDGQFDFKSFNENIIYDEDSCYPAHKMPQDGRFLVLCASEEDTNFLALENWYFLMNLMKKYGRGDQVILKSYPGAGHLLEPPYVPHCAETYHKLLRFYVNYGGRCKEHCKSQEVWWQDYQNLFAEKLGQPCKMSEFNYCIPISKSRL